MKNLSVRKFEQKVNGDFSVFMLNQLPEVSTMPSLVVLRKSRYKFFTSSRDQWVLWL